jgi:hypothetical protein
MKEAETSSDGGGRIGLSTTIITEVKISINELTPKAISKFVDQLRDYLLRAKKSHSKEQIRMMFSEMVRLHDGGELHLLPQWLQRVLLN